MSDKVYTYDDYILSYDYGGENDRSCMIISKILNDNLYVMAELYDGSADVVSIMLDNLQQELQQKENKIKQVREKVKGVKIINNEVYKQTDMLERFYSRKWCNDEMDSFLEILDKE